MKRLSDNNIFAIPLEKDFGMENQYLIYAPLSDNMLKATASECEELAMAIDDIDNAESEVAEVARALMDGIPACERENRVDNVDEFLLMYVLPNYICNFSCSYCFSAKGRSSKALKKEHLKAALDYFIDPNRVSSRRLAISYLGGGEPTISWDVLHFGLEYGGELAEKYGFELMTTIVTNGSRITSEMVEVFNKHNVAVRVSFEILRDIQNLQRGQYDNVCRGIDLLSEGRFPPMVRAMITPNNVNLMPSMIEELHRRFPKVEYVLMDPVTSSEIFSDVVLTEKFYDDYYNNFLDARELGRTLSITLSCAPLRNLNMVVERFCTGEFCLTPEGTITVCHQISSPNEDNYEDYIYARITDDNKLKIDNNLFRTITKRTNLYAYPRCRDCFVKWNCGGGCMMQNKQYSPEIMEVICRFTRRISTKFLLERIEEEEND